MSSLNRERARRLAWLPTLLGVLALAAINGATLGQPPAPTREQQISEIRKQMDELAKKLDAIDKPATKAEPAKADNTLTPGAEWLKPLTWRSIGPASMGGRIVALSVFEADPSTFWVATGGGGLLKTSNNGITFEHQFDKEATVAIGDVCVAPSDKNIVWVGTGENNPRNSVSYGDGVYKSTDGGKTWTNVGLKGTFQIGRIVIHPKDPNIVYVGALGRLYGPNDERGLFKTTDAGKTWQKILYVDDKTGIVEMKMHPTDPETLLVATYERLRDLYDTGDPIKKWGAGDAIHKTTDGGKTFKKLEKGLPTVKLGRIGLDYSRKDPKVVLAIIDSEKIGTGPRAKSAVNNAAYVGVTGEAREDAPPRILQVVAESPAAKAGVRVGDIVKTVDGKSIKAYNEFVAILRDKKVGDTIKLTLERESKPVDAAVTLAQRPPDEAGGPGGGGGGGGGGNRPPPTGQGVEPGGTVGEGFAGLQLDASRPFGAALGGQIENAQDRQGPDSFQTGGVYKSTDGGESWTRVNSLNPRPFYFSQIRVDPSDENTIYVLGLALHKSTDGGKTFRGDGSRGVHADMHALWIDARDGRHMVLGCDGGLYQTYDKTSNWDHLNTAALGQFYHVAIDTKRPYRAYGGLQDNGTWGGPTMNRTTEGPVNEDWLSVGGGDGFKCQVDPTDEGQIYGTSQYGALNRRNLRTGEYAPIRPVLEKGKIHRFNWNTPFILSSHNPKIYYAAGEVVFRSLNKGDDLRPISPEVTRTKTGSASALAESPRNPDVLYVGTDDGSLWITTNGGAQWTEITKNVGLDRPCYVSTIEPSRYEEGRVYVAFDGHRSDTDDPLAFVSEDFGKTWKPIRSNLPRGSTHTLREDMFNPDLLYAGTEFAAWASLDRGASWVKINNNLPTVAIFEFAQHPTAGEVVVATHGRSLWVLDVSPLRQLTKDTMKAKATLLKPNSTIRWQSEPTRGGTNRKFNGQNPPRGAAFYVALTAKPEKGATVKILDYDGATAFESRVPSEPGLHKFTWNMTRPAPAQRPAAGAGRTGGGALGGFFGRRGGMNAAGPGTYRVVLNVDGVETFAPLKLEADPAYINSEISAEALAEMEEMAREADADPDAGMDGDDDEEKKEEKEREAREKPRRPIDEL